MNNTKRLGLPKKRGPAQRGFSRGPGLSLQGRNAWAGMLFVAPFTIGFVAFMAVPLFQSLFMVFTQVTLDPAAHRFYMTFTGLENLKRVFLVDPNFNRLLTEELLRMLLIVPAVLIFSLFAALLLNQDFKGRGVVRVFFFLPVILSSGILINLEMNNALMNGMAELVRKQNAAKTSVTGILEDVLIANWNLIPMSGNFFDYILDVVDQIYTVVMASGVQIVIFLSALQTIPVSMYEAARMEGTTEWECFWKITFPMLSPLILVNVVYSVVDYFLRTDNRIMEKIQEVFTLRLEYGFTMAMTWVYFLAVAAVLGVVSILISRRIYYYE